MYANDDPVNFNDPTGRIPCDVSIEGDCGGGGEWWCDPGSDPFCFNDSADQFVQSLPGSRSLYAPRLTWAALLAASLAANRAAAADQHDYHYPTTLRVVGDACAMGGFGIPTVNAVRAITYQVLDQYGMPWNYSDGQLSVDEIVENVGPPGSTTINAGIAGGVWSTDASNPDARISPNRLLKFAVT